MKIGIIGAGHMGSTLARLFVKAGHEVALANSRGPASLKPLIDELGPKAQAMTVAEAARWAEIVVLVVPWHKPEALPPADAVQAKIVIDAMNPYMENGGLYDLGESTSSEETLKRLPGARLVKAFNTIYYRNLAADGRTDLPLEHRLAIYLAGDDRDAKLTVSKLIEQIGFAPVSTGSLRDGGRLQQPGSAIYNNPMKAADARELLTQHEFAEGGPAE
jgi:8-hydroxy-5-deazaflavin:NADPH oxidoreductase